MLKKHNTIGNKSFWHKIRKLISELVLFSILLFLPVITLWVAFRYLEKEYQNETREETLIEMAEITDHMLRKTEPELCFNDTFIRLAQSFKWAEKLEDVPRPYNKDLLELALFDSEGNRLNWPENENIIKKRSSEKYIEALKRLSSSQQINISPEDQSIAIGYSGNAQTINALALSPNTLINFQGLGLNKMGGWYKVKFAERNPNGGNKEGYLIAWIHLEKLPKYDLAQSAVNLMQKLVSNKYVFSYLDLNDIKGNKTSHNKSLKNNFAKLLSSGSLKSTFIYQNNMFAISDTKEGIRLICSRPDIKPIPLLKTYNQILLIFLPLAIGLFIWKKVFKVKFNLSIKTQTFLIFGFASILSIITILIAYESYRYSKEATLSQKYQNNAIEILEKIDEQYPNSFDDLSEKYKNYQAQLVKNPNSYKKILSPLLRSQSEGTIIYSVYIDQYGQTLFQAPAINDNSNTGILGNRYNYLAKQIAVQCLKDFNSSRSKVSEKSNPESLNAVTANAVQGLLSGRSKLLSLKINNDENLAYMDFIVDNNNYAIGCLLVIHEMKSLENRYLRKAGMNISTTTGFELIAFPKNTSSTNSYFPRYSYIKEEPLWKLNGQINQNQLPSFKKGKVLGKKVIVAAISGQNIKNHNLFLSMPNKRIISKELSLSNVLVAGIILTLLFITIFSLIICSSITSTINKVSYEADAIKESILSDNKSSASNSNELVSIANGLTNLVFKVKEFDNYSNVNNTIFPINYYKNSQYEINGFNSISNDNTNCFCHIASPKDSIVFAFIMELSNNDKFSSSLSLTIIKTAISNIIKQYGMVSPQNCLKSLADFLLINFRQNLTGNMLAMFLNTETNTVQYAGLGNIKLLSINLSNNETSEFVIPNTNNSYEELSNIENQTLELQPNSILLFSTNSFPNNEYASLINNITNQDTSSDPLENRILNHLESISAKSQITFTTAFIHRKKMQKESSILLKNANINPIALIRSQNTGTTNNA